MELDRSVMEKKLLFIVNPKAGTGKIRLSLLDIVDVFIKKGYEVLLHPTQKARDALEKAMEYADKVDLIVCSGGDGTLDEVVTGLMRAHSKTPVGYIPTGSTNDFANSLFMPKDPKAVAENIMNENIYLCDVGRFNHQTFTYVAAFGLFTDVSYQTSQDMKNILGHLAYVLEGARRLLDIKSYHMIVESNGKVLESDFVFGMVTNSRSVGGFKNLSRNVDMNDGLFEVTLIEMPRNPMELQQIISALLAAEDTLEIVHTFKTGKIDFTCKEAVPWTLDGEFGGNHMDVEIENHREALSLFLTSTKQPPVNEDPDGRIL